MKKLLLAAITAAGAGLAVPPAFADQTTDDVHCYIIFMQAGTSSNPDRQTAAALGGLYYLGRLDGRDPGFDLETSVMAEIPKLKGDLRRAEAARCGEEMKDRGDSASAMAEDVQEKLAAQRQKENSQ